MNDSSPVIPNYEGVPEDDNAEPEDADIDHSATLEDVEGAADGR